MLSLPLCVGLQCMTVSGYGRKMSKDPATGQVVIESELCGFGTYNSGALKRLC
jgi:hypothetical protein